MYALWAGTLLPKPDLPDSWRHFSDFHDAPAARPKRPGLHPGCPLDRARPVCRCRLSRKVHALEIHPPVH